MIGYLIDEITRNSKATLESFHLIGHSLGAHVSGYAGKFLNGKLGQITGLDPAGPRFEGLKMSESRLWHTDANFVDSIHSNTESGLHFGMKEPCSHVDIFPNGGLTQSSCGHGHLKE